MNITETALECIHRSCGILADMYATPTLTGARTSDLIRDIIQAADELDRDAARAAEMLDDHEQQGD